MFYETTMYFGANKQEIPVILDTSTSNTYITTDECGSCRYTKFNRGGSKTLQHIDPKQNKLTEYLEIYYPKLNRFVFTGEYYSDQVCIDRD